MSAAPTTGRNTPKRFRLLHPLSAGGLSIRALCVGLVVVCLLPAFVLAGLLALQLANAKRAELQGHTERVTRELADVIDHEISGTKRALEVLAASQNLDRDDLDGFERKLREVSARLGMHLVLRDPAGDRQLINTGVPPGTRFERRPSVVTAEEQESLRTLKPTVSNLVFGPLLKQDFVIVQVPVVRNGKPTYVLSIALTPRKLRALFDRVPFGNIDRVILADGNKVAITRLLDADRWAGRRLSGELMDAVTGPSGTWSGRTTDGFTVFGAYRRLNEAPWVVGSTVPWSAVNVPLYTTLTILAAFAALVLGLSIYAAHRFGSAVSLSVRQLAEAGLALGRIEAVEQVITPFSEANAVSKQLSTASRAIVQTEQQHRFAIDAAGAGAYERNIVTGELFWSSRFKELIGVAQDTAPHDDLFLSRVVPADRHIIEHNRRAYREDLDGVDSYEIEFRLMATTARPVLWAAIKGRVERGPGRELLRVHGIILDVTERKQMEHERDNLQRRLMSVQENERLRLSHELHDETGQILAATLLDMKAIEMMSGPDAVIRLRHLQKRLEGMGQSLHRIAWELRPASLEELGLADAVTNYAGSWSRQFGIETDVHCSGDLGGLETDVSTTVYRVLQEALTNVAKHAKGATVVSIVLDRNGAQLRLTIEDDGKGFDGTLHRAAVVSGRLGLAGIRERLSLIGGSVEIESSADCGTGIFARIPLDRAA